MSDGLIILAVLLADASLPRETPWRQPQTVLTAYLRLWRRRLAGPGTVEPPWGIVATLLPPVIGVLILQSIAGWDRGPLAAAFAILVLFATLHYRRLDGEVEAYVHALEGGNPRALRAYAHDLADQEGPEPNAPNPATVIGGIFTRANHEWSAVIFWFVLLGPMGAVMQRLSVEMSRTEWMGPAYRPFAQQLQAVLAWVPARLMGLTFVAISPHRERIRLAWTETAQRTFASMPARNRALLSGLGLAALGPHRDDEAVRVRRSRGLILRTLVLWIIVLIVLGAIL
jgi:membrane protein required for beta-lactamase induction